MPKKILLVVLAVICLSLCSCSSANELGLKLAEGEQQMEIIYYDGERNVAVNVFDGIMMAGEDENAVMLETELHDGNITIDQILSMAKQDAEDGDVEYTEYPDGSVEYYYETFTMIHMNDNGVWDILFLPSGKGYKDIK